MHHLTLHTPRPPTFARPPARRPHVRLRHLRWFTKKRSARFEKAEEQRKLLEDPKSAAYSKLVIVRMMEAASSQVPGMSRPFKIHDYELLLEAVDLNSLGNSKDLQARIFESQVSFVRCVWCMCVWGGVAFVSHMHGSPSLQDIICHFLGLNREEIRALPAGGEDLVSDEEDDPITCSKCDSGDASSDNPILKCDGDHAVEIGYHLQCTDLDSTPDGDWFCPACKSANVWVAEQLLDKKVLKGRCANPCVHYKVRWKGFDSSFDTWEPRSNLPSAMMAAYTKAHKQSGA